MTSKEALNNFIGTKSCMNCNYHEDCDDFVKCPCDEWKRIIKQDLNELQQYKQLERELGIDLITLFKALKNGVYVKNEYAYDEYEIEYKKVRGIEKTGLSAISNICEFPECDELLCYSNYGKFWALTEEELKNDK